ncbi:hypothetical protein [Agrobacterium sp. NPDC090273]|uniref:hypothetical protein n=1 Tax=Agrobacterium sp. NPDC090273 TaxID=3363919 RepID=UPI00383AC004
MARLSEKRHSYLNIGLTNIGLAITCLADPYNQGNKNWWGSLLKGKIRPKTVIFCNIMPWRMQGWCLQVKALMAGIIRLNGQ